MRLIRGQTSISVPKNNFRFSGKPRQPTPRQDQNRPHVQFPQSAHTESKELAPTFLRREVASAAITAMKTSLGTCAVVLATANRSHACRSWRDILRQQFVGQASLLRASA